MKPDWSTNRLKQSDSCNTQRWRRGLQRDVRQCVNPHGVAFPLWICVCLNFSRRGWQGAIGHSVNVSGSEQPEPRQPRAVVCHSSLLFCLCLAAVYFLLSFPRPPPSPALSDTFIIVFYLSFSIACRKIAHLVIDKAVFCFCVSLFLSFLWIPIGLKSTSLTTFWSHITQFHRPYRIYFFLIY